MQGLKNEIYVMEMHLQVRIIWPVWGFYEENIIVVMIHLELMTTHRNQKLIVLHLIADLFGTDTYQCPRIKKNLCYLY